MTYPCPHCGAPASSETGCPACGRGPDPDAIEVIRTDARIGELMARLATARRAVFDLEAEIGQAWQIRNAAVARVRAAVGTPTTPETSTRTVQNVLFVLGGLLLGVAAIVFTAVAWAQFGVAGRATILGAFTVAALAVPPLALRRRLRGTAETMAAVGLLLVLLDGYAAWYVDLFGVAGGSPFRYAGLVFAFTAVLAAGYAVGTGLTGPRHVALLAFQPVLPLLVAPAHPGAAGWSLTFGALAAVDLVARRARVAPVAYACGGLAALVALAPAADAAVRTVETARPVLHAAWFAAVPSAGWALPVALALVAAALFVALPARLRPAAPVAGAAAVVLALPAGLHLAWWNGPILDLLVVAVVLGLAARRAAPVLHAPAARVASLPVAASPSAASAAASAVTLGTRVAASPSVAFVCQLCAAVLLGLHGLVAGFGRPGVATGVLAAFAVLGVGLALRGRHAVLAGAGWFVALVALPGIAWTGAITLGLSGVGQARAVAVAAAVGLLLLALFDLASRASRAADLASRASQAAPTPFWVGPSRASGSDNFSAFSTAGGGAALAAIPLLGLTLLAAEAAGLTAPASGWLAIPAAMLLLGLAGLLTAALRPASPAASTPASAAGLGPASPAVSAAASPAGLGPASAAGLGPTSPVVPVVGGLLALAGLVGCLVTRPVTLAALGAILLAASVTGTAARTAAARGLGVAVAVAAGLGVAVTAPAGAVLEAYTLPASGLALAAALLARRDHSSSWATYGPALATGLLPSLFLVLAEDGHLMRRLLLGLAALAVLLAGAKTRLRAPVVAGGGTLAMVALHEVALVWELVPRWIPLAAGGVLLVVLAATLEARRRDLARVRQALGRMT